MRASLLIHLFIIALTSCASEVKETPDFVRIYERGAQTEDGMRNPVVVNPGIMGSRLIAPETPEGARLAALPLAPQLETSTRPATGSPSTASSMS